MAAVYRTGPYAFRKAALIASRDSSSTVLHLAGQRHEVWAKFLLQFVLRGEQMLLYEVPLLRNPLDAALSTGHFLLMVVTMPGRRENHVSHMYATLKRGLTSLNAS
jgi:hypothetical protein